ncbi:MAG: serine/threonine-protein phosphatase [Planctomycetaceae bacterium]|nr:serine/threonine-protein phosphatase [Planctomycetaceae bacterium]
MQWTPKFQYASRSDVGMKRQNNEDNYSITLCPEETLWLTRGHLFAVADGMGGHEVGELASKSALDTLPHVYFKSGLEQPADALHDAFQEANRSVFEIGNRNRDFKRLGTTCSALVAFAEGYLVGHVGDSRIYRVRDERIDQLTFDHTVGWEQRLRRRRQPDEAELPAEKYSHVLTRCLGPDPSVRIDIEGPFEYMPGDVFIICSDGLTKYVSDVEIGTYAKHLPVPDAVKLLTNLANLRGGADNCTVIIIRVTRQDGSVTPPPTADYPIPVETSPLLQPALFAGTLLFGVAAGLLSYHQWAIPAALSGMVSAALLFAGYQIGKKRNGQPGSYGDYEIDEEGNSTVFFRPYRTAALRLSAASVQKLKDATEKIRETAVTYQWKVDLEACDRKIEQANNTFSGQKLKQAMLEYSRAIDLLMQNIPR